MKTSSSESLITGILFRLSILAVGIGGVTAALFAAADALEHRVPAPAADAAKVGPTFAARDTNAPAPRPRTVEATASVPAAAPTRPAAALPADRPASPPPAAARQDAPRQDLAGLPAPAEVGAARALAPADALSAVPSSPAALPAAAPETPARPETSRTRPAAASPSTVPLETAARPAVGIDDARPAAGATPAPGSSASATPAARPQRGQAGCTQYRSYDPKTGTYRGFDGKVRECNAVASN